MTRRSSFSKRSFSIALAGAALALSVGSPTRRSVEAAQPSISTAAFKADVDAFFDREIPAHFTRIPDHGPLPDRVHGALTTGEFSWGTFVRALAAYAETRQTRLVGGREVVPLVGRVGVIESANGSKAFAQLYAALALRHFGADLARNALWQSLSAADRKAWRALLDPTRFYDAKTRRVIDLPENYLGVASRIATLAFQMGLLEDRVFVDALLDRAAEPFVRGALYADDAGTVGRYDRYSNEYARYVYEAAETAGRRDVMRALEPSLIAQMKLWWDLLSADGYGYQWGRSLGVVSYLDTLEIVAFVARHPTLRPASLADLASVYRLAWRWLQNDYGTDRHLLSVFAPGRGNYAYITREREWQQTVGFFGKALVAQETLMRALSAEKVGSFAAQPHLPAVARFEHFRRGPRAAGVWVVRQGLLRFALPITTGTKPGVADYLPAPHGLPGFSAPVEQVVAAGAPFFTTSGGRTVVPTDGADEITPGQDGRSLHAVWRRFAVIGASSGELIDPGFVLSTEWRIEGSTLTRVDTLTTSKDVILRQIVMRVPSTAQSAAPLLSSPGTTRLAGSEGVLDVRLDGDLPFATSIHELADTPFGRGARGAIPRHIMFEANNIRLFAGLPVRWTLRLEVSAPTERTAR